MKRARRYQQCFSARDQQTGSFLYNPETKEQYSPTFTDSVEFLQWCRANNWRPEYATLGSDYVQA